MKDYNVIVLRSSLVEMYEDRKGIMGSQYLLWQGNLKNTHLLGSADRGVRGRIVTVDHELQVPRKERAFVADHTPQILNPTERVRGT